MNKNVQLAVLITCYNRREKTLLCLRSLFSQVLPPEASFIVYLMDDGSSDGTSDAVASEFPQIQILQGNGALYWCGGMRVAWAEAMINDYDGYLWLNDDVELLPNALFVILKTWSDLRTEMQVDPIIVGTCRDPRTDMLVYGGYPRDLSKGVLPESSHPQRCHTMNGNIVLVPREVVKVVGNLSPDYTHAMGDIDYGLRASEKGFAVYIVSGTIGLCEVRPRSKWMSSAVPFIERWKDLHSPKGLPPWEYMKLRRRCGVPFWFLVPLKLYVRVCLPWLWEGKASLINLSRNHEQIVIKTLKH